MKIAVCSDESYSVGDYVVSELRKRGHHVLRMGALDGPSDVPWAEAAEQAARKIVDGVCDEGIFFCWTGTGIAMAANKLPGIRAALCSDPGTAAGARIWNHANVLCLSNRTLSHDMAGEILDAWFGTPPGNKGDDGVARMAAVDERWRGQNR